jgi:hypothetical protein
MDKRARREQEFFWGRVGLVRRGALVVTGIAIAAVVGLVLWGLVAGQMR